MQEKENEIIYPIPPNYTDSGKIFGGMVSPRNLVEAILLVLVLGFIEFKLIALDYVWDTVKADRTQKKAVFIDEIWQLVGASSTRTAADFCLTIFKTIRGFGGAAIAATQDLSDFFGLDDGKYGRAIVNNSQNKIILNLEPDEAKYVEEILKLTKNETRLISHFNRGEALICSNNNKVPVNIIASKKEQTMITTDREELEKIYRAGRGTGSA